MTSVYFLVFSCRVSPFCQPILLKPVMSCSLSVLSTNQTAAAAVALSQLYALVANIIFGQLCFLLAACACCQATLERKRRRCERVGQAMIGAVATVLLIWAPWFVNYVSYNGESSTQASSASPAVVC